MPRDTQQLRLSMDRHKGSTLSPIKAVDDMAHFYHAHGENPTGMQSQTRFGINGQNIMMTHPMKKLDQQWLVCTQLTRSSSWSAILTQVAIIIG